jgi:putative transposase
MPRSARLVIPGLAHHVTQRGNNHQDVFFVNGDRRIYFALLKDRCDEAGVRVLGYCLMTNHVHLIVVPPDEESLATAVGRTHWLYTQYVNRVHGRSGHLWQNRFFSCALDKPHLWTALRYIERNPLRAGTTRAAWNYPWSSAAAHVGARPDPSGVLDLTWWRKEWPPRRWRTQLAQPLEDDEIGAIQRHLHAGRPLATDRFLARLEAKLNRRLRPLPVGRPRREDK